MEEDSGNRRRLAFFFFDMAPEQAHGHNKDEATMHDTKLAEIISRPCRNAPVDRGVLARSARVGRVSGGGGRYLAQDGAVVEDLEDGQVPPCKEDNATEEADKCPCQDHGVSTRSARVGRVSGGGGRHVEKGGARHDCPCVADQNDNAGSTRSARVGRVSGGGGR